MERPKSAEPERVVIDHVRHVVEIDGEPVPYWIAEGGPTTEPLGKGETLVKFECFVIAKDVQVIGRQRERSEQPPVEAVACSSLFRRSAFSTTYLCSRSRGHDGKHGYAGVFWTDDDDEASA